MDNSMQPVLEQIQVEAIQLKELQRDQNEKLKEPVQQARCIGKAVSCGESRQDAWTGESIKYLSHDK